MLIMIKVIYAPQRARDMASKVDQAASCPDRCNTDILSTELHILRLRPGIGIGAVHRIYFPESTTICR